MGDSKRFRVPNLGEVTDPHWLDDDEMRVWRGFIRASTALLGQLDNELEADHAISLGEYEILVFLAEAEQGLRMKELASKALVSKSRLTHTCNRLEQAGLVARLECPTDRRGLVAVLTPAGQAKLESAAPSHLRGVRQYLVDVLSVRQRGSMAVALEAVLSALGQDPSPPRWPAGEGAASVVPHDPA
jgi:DNA-binding MarR family transcriptional regulator